VDAAGDVNKEAKEQAYNDANVVAIMRIADLKA